MFIYPVKANRRVIASYESSSIVDVCFGRMLFPCVFDIDYHRCTIEFRKLYCPLRKKEILEKVGDKIYDCFTEDGKIRFAVDGHNMEENLHDASIVNLRSSLDVLENFSLVHKIEKGTAIKKLTLGPLGVEKTFYMPPRRLNSEETEACLEIYSKALCDEGVAYPVDLLGVSAEVAYGKTQVILFVGTKKILNSVQISFVEFCEGVIAGYGLTPCEHVNWNHQLRYLNLDFPTYQTANVIGWMFAEHDLSPMVFPQDIIKVVSNQEEIFNVEYFSPNLFSQQKFQESYGVREYWHSISEIAGGDRELLRINVDRKTASVWYRRDRDVGCVEIIQDCGDIKFEIGKKGYVAQIVNVDFSNEKNCISAKSNQKDPFTYKKHIDGVGSIEVRNGILHVRDSSGKLNLLAFVDKKNAFSFYTYADLDISVKKGESAGKFEVICNNRKPFDILGPLNIIYRGRADNVEPLLREVKDLVRTLEPGYHMCNTFDWLFFFIPRDSNCVRFYRKEIDITHFVMLSGFANNTWQLIECEGDVTEEEFEHIILSMKLVENLARKE